MKIKKYTADSMSEALQKVKDDLGSRAVLLNTRQIKKDGAMAILSRKKVEITAALDDSPPIPNKSSHPHQKRSQPPSGSPSAPTSGISRGASKEARDPRRSSDGDEASGPLAERVSREIRELKEILKTRSPSHYPRPEGGALPLPGQLLGLSERMDFAGFGGSFAASLIERLLVDPGPGGFEDRGKLEQQAAKFIVQTLPGATPSVVNKGVRTVAALVGTAGAGKTTAAAKIAGEFALRQKSKVCLVAADVERVAGLDQIRALAGMIGVPLHVVYTAEEMSSVIRGQRETDLILIDTPGLGPQDGDKLKGLSGILREAAPNEVHLILGATTGASQMADVAEAFRPIGTNRLLFTKLDETARLGGILTMAASSNITLSYLTDGRSVPGDIRPADPMDLALQAIR